MENVVLIGIGIAIIYNTYVLYKKQKEVRKATDELKKANDDLNIEFGSSDGSGIEFVKKNYPYIKDNHRESTGEVKKHTKGK